MSFPPCAGGLPLHRLTRSLAARSRTVAGSAALCRGTRSSPPRTCGQQLADRRARTHLRCPRSNPLPPLPLAAGACRPAAQSGTGARVELWSSAARWWQHADGDRAPCWCDADPRVPVRLAVGYGCEGGHGAGTSTTYSGTTRGRAENDHWFPCRFFCTARLETGL